VPPTPRREPFEKERGIEDKMRHNCDEIERKEREMGI
jgi:hypothetical protein